ncbi:MAG: hypothetical protein ACE366_05640 [Bradymonadia bacterium]
MPLSTRYRESLEPAAPKGPLRKSWLAAMLLWVMATGCATDENTAPVIQPLADVQCLVNVSCEIVITAVDAENDTLTWSQELSPDPFQLDPNRVTSRPRIVGNTGAGRFQWTPISSDAGDGERIYDLTLRVSDGRGGRDAVTIALTVVNGGVGGNSEMRFTEPPGAGIVVDPDEEGRLCARFPVIVRADSVASENVFLDMEAPLIPGARLSPEFPAKEKQFEWCPTEDQLNTSLTSTVIFRAVEEGGDEPIVKRFLIRFRREAAVGCPGKAPEIEHTPPGSFDGPLNYELQAVIRDDVGFKSPPILSFSGEPGATPDETSGWETVSFRQLDGDNWVASVPNLNLADGEERLVYYAITATDNDDPNGTRCDHSTQSEVFSFTAVGGGGGGQTYGFCTPCVADGQCGGAEDLCVDLRGESFCAISCRTEDCPGPNQQCLELTSIDGTTGFQCVPVDLNCGQICAPDALEPGVAEEGPGNAVSVQPGRVENLSICDGDFDYYFVPVEAGQSIEARIIFANSEGDLDLAMNLPGSQNYDYQSLNAGVDVEQVSEPCVGEGGEALLFIFPYEGDRNRYTLEVEVGPGVCDQMCNDDSFDEGMGNDSLEEFAAIEEFPFVRDDLILCRNDPDYYAFDGLAGQVIQAGISFAHRDGDLDLVLTDSEGNVLAESPSYRDVEFVEVELARDDIYILGVYGATPTVSNTYSMLIEIADQRPCDATRACPVDQFCSPEGECRDAECNGSGQCGADHQCLPQRVGLDPNAILGMCAADCRSDADCRQELGYACKANGDFTRSCAPSGAGMTGDRCNNYSDCADDRVCFPSPGGYCAAGGCEPGFVCPDGGYCVALDNGYTACARVCEGEGDCRAQEGYSCQNRGGAQVCLP